MYHLSIWTYYTVLKKLVFKIKFLIIYICKSLLVVHFHKMQNGLSITYYLLSFIYKYYVLSTTKNKVGSRHVNYIIITHYTTFLSINYCFVVLYLIN